MLDIHALDYRLAHALVAKAIAVRLEHQNFFGHELVERGVHRGSRRVFEQRQAVLDRQRARVDGDGLCQCGRLWAQAGQTRFQELVQAAG
jgi:hypothetical protein